MGEAHLDDEEKEILSQNEDSRIVFLNDDEKVFITIVFSCPLEHGLNGVTGLKYEALKDFIKWNYNEECNLEEITKVHLPYLLELGKVLAREINDNRTS